VVIGDNICLLCSAGHAAAFAVNAAFMSNQWQHRASTVPSHPSINAEHEAGQVAGAIFQVFGMKRNSQNSRQSPFLFVTYW